MPPRMPAETRYFAAALIDIFYEFVYLKLPAFFVKILLWLILFVPNVKRP